MQAYRAYFDEGKFIPLEPVEIINGSQAIVTVLDFPIVGAKSNEVSFRQKAALKKFRDAIRNSDPLTTEFDEVMNQRINITRELDL